MSSQSDPTLETFSSTLDIRTEQNPYPGELMAMAIALSRLLRLRYRNIVLLMRCKSAALVIRQPRQQSGQEQARRAYESTRALRREGNTIRVVWLPSSKESELLTLAKEKAKAATQKGAFHDSRSYSSRVCLPGSAVSNLLVCFQRFLGGIWLCFVWIARC